jgi:hypothetical protein
MIRLLARVEWSRVWHLVDIHHAQPARPRDLAVSACYDDRRDDRTGGDAWRYLWLRHPTGLIVALALVAAPQSYTPLGWARVALLAILTLVLATWTFAPRRSAPQSRADAIW